MNEAANFDPTNEDLPRLIERLCAGDGLRAVVQPIVRLTDMVVIGYEALARVSDRRGRPIQWWLDAAERAGARSRFEIACLQTISTLSVAPDERLLFVNVSPATLLEPELWALRASLPARLVLELTEQAPVDDYALLRDKLAPWLASGARFAIDDAGAGYSSLRHVIELTPDFLKLDREMVADIDHDHNRRALVRSLVAFAREVGTSVIAEGIERLEELETLRNAGVAFGQGYLLARPGPPWPRVALGQSHQPTGVDGRGVRDQIRLQAALKDATTAVEACSVVVDHIFEEADLMPSLYLERDGRLRCIAQRGLWQVLDGLSGAAGITGRTWATNTPIVLDDVTASDEYLEAIPGVVAEICIPIVVESTAIGSLNVESVNPLPTGTLARMRTYSQLLARRLSAIGFRTETSPWQRSSTASATIAGLVLNQHTRAEMLSVLCGASLQDSACLIRTIDDDHVVSDTYGPLSNAFRQLAALERASLAGVVDRISSCYTAGETTGRGFVGTESLRTAGARSVIVLPLRANSHRIGTLVLANTRPRNITAQDVEPLELLAALLAATFHDTAIPT